MPIIATMNSDQCRHSLYVKKNKNAIPMLASRGPYRPHNRDSYCEKKMCFPCIVLYTLCLLVTQYPAVVLLTIYAFYFPCVPPPLCKPFLYVINRALNVYSLKEAIQLYSSCTSYRSAQFRFFVFPAINNTTPLFCICSLYISIYKNIRTISQRALKKKNFARYEIEMYKINCASIMYYAKLFFCGWEPQSSAQK